MQFTHNIDGVVHIFTTDPNEIHVITYKEVKYLCDKNEIEWKNLSKMRLNGKYLCDKNEIEWKNAR